MAALCRTQSRHLLSHSYRTLSLFSTLSSPSSPSLSPFRSVKSAIESESDPIKLAGIFESSAASARFRRHRPLFHLSVRKLSRSGRPDLVERVINHTIAATADSSSHLRSEGFWIRIAMLYSSAGMVDHAVQTFNQMENHNCARTEKSLCAMLSVHLDNKMYDEFHELFASIPTKIGVAPGVKSYNLVLKAFCEENRVDLAQELVNKMENEAMVLPDIHSYNILLGAYWKNKDGGEFDRVLKMVVDKELDPNLTTYNYRIMKLCKSKEIVRAKKVFDEMLQKGVKPNSASYNSLIAGFCKVGDLESAKVILERMVGDGYASPPSFAYYTLMRHMVEEGEFDSALEMCKEIMRRKWVPPFEVMEGLVNGLVKMSKSGDAKEVVEKMKTRLKGSAVDSWGKIEAVLPL
ncbi:Pentatricopeptide repeat-containing protein [Actinidia chinensis var. chinensis]|uniref:Pentatricopeptide repeat-containing protein n=1 Tax=Actinidia chinensis var. chinensis TaxID=1590841 RepID=A0A2R6QST1_ACTCC|nr:Pentatricopeptide repeat-containing protein [Actinidia chinensis var. chinensis]